MKRMVYICKPLLPLLLRCFNIAIALLFLAACAQVVAPNGGPADSTPPRLLSSEPAFQALNMHEKKMKIRFSEYITTRDADKQLIVSPPMRNAPVLKPRGKTLLVEWDDTLKANTTYVFQFGKSVVDITEGNAAENLRMVFSTGEQIDTGMMRGRVVMAKSGEPAKEFTVMLYDSVQSLRDSFAAKQMPAYFARTAADGNFTIGNVRPGTYSLLALKDGNSNYLYDDVNEGIAFCDTQVRVGAEPVETLLRAFQALPSKQYLKSHDFSDRRMFRFLLNKPAEQFALRSYACPDINFMGFTEFVSGSDSATVWFSDSLRCDSIHLIPVADGKELDTLHASLRNLMLKAKGRTGKYVPLKRNSCTTNISSTGAVHPAEGLVLRFAPPVSAYHSGKAWLLLGKDSLPALFTRADSAGHAWRLSAKLLTDTQYRLTVLPGAFVLKNGYASDSIQMKFSSLNPDKTGKLTLQVTHPSAFPLLVYVKDNSGKILRSQTLSSSSETLVFDLLIPGKYAAEAIEDRNANGRWDTGDYHKRMQPEHVWKYSGELEIRASWELEKAWEILR